MPKRSLAEALLKGKCPVCREGQMFTWSVLRKPHKFNNMNEFCPHCNTRLQPEPGFYQGAMYVSYGFIVMITVAASLILYYGFDNPSEWVYIGVIIGASILFVPWNYRYSRIVYLYAFGGLKYKPELSKPASKKPAT
jgi:uncharacterized protein (DUF983 family)